MSTTEAILERDAAHNSMLFSPDLVLTHGQGIHVFDADGKRYYDCLAGIAVASLGHAHPRLVRAISEQAGRLMSCTQNLGNDVRTELGEKLARMAGSPLSRVFLVSSGSEANEAALKWAMAATGRRRFVACRKGFSGRTMGVLPLTWEPKYREPFGELSAHVTFVDYNDVEAIRAAVTDETAAVMIEPIQGEGGVHVATDAFLRAAREATAGAGALLVFDEIQSGSGRTGTFLASEPSKVVPDMVTLAKGLGGGVPIGALVMREDVAARMPAGGHGTTFGGNPLSAAAALAVLGELEDGVMENAAATGAWFRQRLEEVSPSRIREVRGRGLMIGVEVKGPAAPVIRELRERGVLCINAGESVIRFVPPLIITRQEVDEIVAITGDALAAI